MQTSIRLLTEAKNEITSLRKQNDLMAARLDMFDKMMLLFYTEPRYQGQAMAPDLVWEIEKFVTSELTSTQENEQ